MILNRRRKAQQSLYTLPLFKTTMNVKQIYEEKYKLLMIIPFALVLFALLQIGVQYAQTGDFVNRGISLKGGSTITITKEMLPEEGELETFLLQQFPETELSVRTMSAAGKAISVLVETDIQTKEGVDGFVAALTSHLQLQDSEYSVEIVGSSLGENFFKQTAIALLVSFLLMALVVIAYFRILIPSLAVILAAFSDIVVTLAIFNLTGMKLSTAGVAAFLMLIGYSVDTDVLLTTRLLKRHEGSPMERIYGAIKTGLTMTSTALVAVTVALFLVQSDIVKQIMFILFIGLLVDLVMTWIQNVGILRLYLERKRL